MKGRLIFLFFLIGSFSSYSQDESDTVVYSVLFDDPNTVWFGVGGSFDVSANNYNFTLIGLGVDFQFVHPKFSAKVNSRIHLLERLADYGNSGHTIAESVYEPENSRDAYLEGTYFFFRKTNKIGHRVSLKSTSKVDYVTYVDAKMDSRYGLDLGFGGGFSYFNFGEDVITGVSDEGEKVKLESNSTNKAISSFFSQNNVRIGLSRTNTSNFEGVFSGYGKRSVLNFSKIYFHSIIAFGQDMEDVWFEDVIDDTPFGSFDNSARYSIHDNLIYRSFGAAIGCERYFMGREKNRGFGLAAELGIAPGVKGSLIKTFSHYVYLDLKVRLHFGKLL